jgi:hypothetical protein
MARAGAVLAALLACLLAPAPAAAQGDGRKLSQAPNRFGAIAHHRPSRSWGVSHDFARQRDASVEALRQCGHRNCEVVHKFKNGCAALADGPAKSAIASGVTRDEAETRALKRCGQEGCSVLAWVCTR